MSIEYEVRFDDDYTRHASVAEVRELLVREFGATPEAPVFLIYNRDAFFIEISLGIVHGCESSSCKLEYVDLRIPASAHLKSADVAINISFAIAKKLGWRVFDPQRGDYIESAELEPGPPISKAIGQLFHEVRQEATGRLLARIWARFRRQSMSSVGQFMLCGVAIVLMASWVLYFRP